MRYFLEWCGVNNSRIAGYSSVSLEDPMLFPKVYCERIWARECERLAVVDSNQIFNEDSRAKVLCAGNYRKVEYKTFEYSHLNG